MAWLDLVKRRAVERASPEDPSTPLSNPTAWLYDALGASRTHAGPTIGEHSAHKFGPFWACVEIRSKTLATVGCHVYRRLPDGGRKRATDHPAYRLLHLQANPEMTAFTFHQTLDSHVAVWGNGYAEIERDRQGRPLALWPLLPDRTKPCRVSEVDARELGSEWGAGKYLRVRLENGAEPPEGFPVRNSEVYIPPGFYLHVPGLGFDGLQGYSRVAFHKQALGIGLAAEEFQARFYGSGLKPGFLLTTDYQIKPDQAEQLRAKLEQYQAGLSQSHRMMILEKGLNVEKIGMPLNDAQFLETRQFQVEETARIFDMPLHRLRVHGSGTGHNTIEGQQLDFVQGTILPPATIAQQVFTIELLDADHFAEYQLLTLLKADSKSRSAFYQTLVNIGAMTPNEVRARENLNPSSDSGADKLWMQMSMAPIEDLSGIQMPEPARSILAPEAARRAKERKQRRSATSRWRIQQSYQRLIESAARTFVGYEVEQLRRLATKALKSTENFRIYFLREMESLYESFEPRVQRALLPVIVAFAELLVAEIAHEVNLPEGYEGEAESAAADYVARYTAGHQGSSRGQLEAILASIDGEDQEAQSEAVLQRIGEWADKRPGKIGHREGPRANGEISRAMYAFAGTVSLLQWVHLGGDCGICSALNGRTVGIEHDFIGKGEEISSDQEGQADLVNYKARQTPPAHDGCQNCIIVAG